MCRTVKTSLSTNSLCAMHSAMSLILEVVPAASPHHCHGKSKASARRPAMHAQRLHGHNLRQAALQCL